MSSLASLSNYDKELNSFCTVFAKTEIMNWIFDGMTTQDIARGIYISIANKVAKMRLEPGIPTYMIGGVIAHHPYLKVLLNEKFDKDIQERKKIIEKEIEAEITKAQKEIAVLKKSSIEDIQNISKDLALNIIENISGDKLNESSIKAAVEDVSKKNIDKYL